MLFNNKKFSYNYLINLLLCLIPVSLAIGSLIVNINLYLFLIVSIIYIKKNKLKLNFEYVDIILFIFFVCIIISSALNIETIEYNRVVKSIFLLRFVVLYFVVKTLFINEDIDLKKFFITSLFCTSFVSVDIIFQYFVGYDLFGFKPFEGRIAGIFVSESIAGSYLQKFTLFSIFGTLFLFQKKNYTNRIIFLIILLHLLGTLFTGNRMPLIILIASIVPLLLFANTIRLPVIFSLIAFIAISTVMLETKIYKKDKFLIFFKNIESSVLKLVYSSNTENTDEKNLSMFDLEIKNKIAESNIHHFQIYMTSFATWKNKPLIGNGHKSFRAECRKILSIKGMKCSNHSHNYHIEILHDSGIIGFGLISIFVLIKIYKLLKSYFSISNRHRYDYNLYIIPIMINFFIEVWPIKSTGSIFTTWNGTIVWLMVAFTTLSLSKKINLKK